KSLPFEWRKYPPRRIYPLSRESSGALEAVLPAEVFHLILLETQDERRLALLAAGPLERDFEETPFETLHLALPEDSFLRDGGAEWSGLTGRAPQMGGEMGRKDELS